MLKWPLLFLGAALTILDQLGALAFTHFYPQWVNADGTRFLAVTPLVSGLVAVGLLLYWRRSGLPIALMGAGLASNLISYALYGHFVDIVPMRFWYASTADLLVACGCLLAAVQEIKKPRT